jgi:hypothetical protein
MSGSSQKLAYFSKIFGRFRTTFTRKVSTFGCVPANGQQVEEDTQPAKG